MAGCCEKTPLQSTFLDTQQARISRPVATSVGQSMSSIVVAFSSSPCISPLFRVPHFHLPHTHRFILFFDASYMNDLTLGLDYFK